MLSGEGNSFLRPPHPCKNCRTLTVLRVIELKRQIFAKFFAKIFAKVVPVFCSMKKIYLVPNVFNDRTDFSLQEGESQALLEF